MLFMFFVISTLVHLVAAEVQLQVLGPASLGTSFFVNWTREEGDPTGWDLRIIKQGTDTGKIAARVRKKEEDTSGSVSALFYEEGRFTLKAVIEPGNKVIAETVSFDVNGGGLTSTGTLIQPSGASPASSTGASPTSTSGSPAISPTGTDPAGSPTVASSLASSKRMAAIIGGVIGGLVFLAIVGILVLLFIRRRRRQPSRRLTFHRDMMVQNRDAPRVPLPSTDYDLEAAIAVAQRPSMDRPTSRSSRGSSQTTRQLDIELRITKLQAQILELGNQPAQAHVTEQMRVQVEWLQRLEESPWAMGLTDERPPNYTLYMTS